MKTIIDDNAFSSSSSLVSKGEIEVYILGFTSLINHGNPLVKNLEHQLVRPALSIFKAMKDIKAGEEITYD